MAVQDLNAMAFPKLTEEQITQLARYAGASTKTFREGEALFRAGDRDEKFFVIKSAELGEGAMAVQFVHEYLKTM